MLVKGNLKNFTQYNLFKRTSSCNKSISNDILATVKQLRLFNRYYSTEEPKNYAKTLFLPQTTFNLRANASQREPILRERCTKILYDWQNEKENNKVWVTHDGPPYANGNPHMGHAMNKILKDIINRYKLLTGYKVSYIPGWDCHGLPIEMKALQESGKKQWENTGDPLEGKMAIRTAAKKCAEKAIEDQKKHFVEWGVMGDWDHPYYTMHPSYEAQQLQVFYELYKQGIIYQGKKPVHWSPSSKTALAEAELEYPPNYSSLSAFFKFPVTKITNNNLSDLLSPYTNGKIYIVSWTTTPWTLPANLGVCVNSEFDYCLVEHQPTGNEESPAPEKEFFILAKSRIEHVSEMIQSPLSIVLEFKGDILVDSEYQGLLRSGKVYNASFVTEETGTGIVHTAPGHGLEDFRLLTIEHGIEPLSPVDDEGRYTNELNDDRFTGKEVLKEGNQLVLQILKEQKMFLHSHRYNHKYPHDWRTKKPIIMRATQQWFADVTKIVPNAIKQIQNVEMIPPSGKNRLESVLQQREDWCISRQRSWGVPIPVFYDTETNEPFISQETVDHLKTLVLKHSTDCWWTLSTEELLPPSIRNNGRKYTRCMDTVDVWFDSGVSWASVIQQRNVNFPVDVYLEGSDQHRGWFQSSLLTSVGVTGKAPYKRIITHGFVVDAEGRKMSKSIGNVIDPAEIVRGGNDKKLQPAYGSDLLRSWVASSDYTKDVNISPLHISVIFESQQKIRNTVRFFLGNLFDFTTPLPYSELFEIDQYMLHLLSQFSKDAYKHYEDFNFKKVFGNLVNLSVVDLSSFYFETIKDRLYSDKKDGRSRRSAQTVLLHYLVTITKILSPITCHLAEDIFENTPKDLQKYFQSENNQLPNIQSVFQTGWINLNGEWDNSSLEPKWNYIRSLKSTVNKDLEELRSKSVIKASTEAQVTISLPKGSQELGWLSGMSQSELFLSFGVSKVVLEEGTENVQVVKIVDYSKCPRCWYFTSDSSTSLCSRCDDVMNT